jgi:hypothetical protein
MNIHIMHDDKFINSFIEKYLKFHPPNENIFYIIQKSFNKQLDHVNNPKAVIIILNKKTFKKLFQGNFNIENIFFHNFPLNIFSLIDLIPIQVKIHWIFYGVEIFMTPISLKILDKESLSIYPKIYKTNKFLKLIPDKIFYLLLVFKEKFLILRLQKVLKKIDYFYHWNKLDYLYIKTKFKGFNSEFKYFGYNTNYNRELSENSNKSKNSIVLKKTNKKSIMIGNNSSISLNHISIINYLSLFSLSDFKVILPLNYGNKRYKKFLIKYSRNLLGDKLLVIENFFPYFEYRKLISSIDVLIMNNIRPQGAGNIHIALHEGIKIYMNPLNTHYKFLCNHEIVINSIEELYTSSINDILCPLDYRIVESNKQKRIELDKKVFDWYKDIP